MKKVLLVLNLALALVLCGIPVALADDMATIGISARGEEISITVEPSTWDFLVVSAGGVSATGISSFRLTNNSSVTIDITIAGTDLSGTGENNWILAAEPEEDTYALDAGLADTDSVYDIPVTKIPITLVGDLGATSNQDFGLVLSAPTSISDADIKSGDVIISAVKA